MFSHNFLTYSGKIIAQILGEILYFPIWWYSIGFIRRIKVSWSFLRDREISLGFSVWAKNIFAPMYGQRDFAGRLISFLVRLVQIIARGLVLFLWLIIVLLGLIFWLALPILLLIALAFQFLK